MELAHHVEAIRADLVTAAAVGGDDAAAVGERLAAALESSLHLRLLDVLTEVAQALDSQLEAGRVEVRLAGRAADLVLVDERSSVPDVPDVPAFPGDATSARITLRLPDALKANVEAAAAREGLSTNAWVVRALARAFEAPRASRDRDGRRVRGFVQR